MLSFELKPELEHSLRTLAAERGTSEAEIVRDLVEHYIEDQEDIRLAEAARKIPGRRWTLEELERGRDLES
ncbi:MAG: ribbon-helix-helix protein, CopG family [Rhodospirillaceae bacterium]